MASILEMLNQQLGGTAMEHVGSKLGTDRETTERTTQVALATLVAALRRNSSSGEGAQALASALDKDHDGSVLDNLQEQLTHAERGPGDGILRHVLGHRRAAVESGVSRTTGMDAGSVGKLMTMLAPVVLGALGKAKREQSMGAGDLAGLLGRESELLERRRPGAGSALGRLLDSDGDGDVDADDLLSRAGGVFGKLFGR